jgi:hypothetical protein
VRARCRTLGALVATSLLYLAACVPEPPPTAEKPYASANVPLQPIQCGASRVMTADVVALDQDFGTRQYRPKSLARGTFFDAAGARFTVDNCGWAGEKNPYPALLEKCQDCTWHGGLWSSRIPQDTDWGKTYCNSAAAFAFRDSINFTFASVRIDGAWDGIRFQPRNSDAKSMFVVENSWLSNIRDDCIENDALHDMIIRNSLLDGCFSGISLDPGRAGSSLPDRAETRTVVLENILVRVQDYSFRGEVQPAHFLKVHSASPSIEIRDSIFAFDRVGRVDRRWPKAMSKVTSCSNNYLLWLSDSPMPASFPPVPACFTVLTGAPAREKWEQSRDAWIAACSRPSLAGRS